MNKMRFLLPFLLILSLEGSAQVWHLRRSIIWVHPSDTENVRIDSFTSFRGAVADQFSSVFPVYFELVEWKDVNTTLDAKLVMTAYEDYNGLLTSEQQRELTGRDAIKVSLAFQSMKPYLQITVFPFSIDEYSGKLKRLTSFVVRLEAVSVIQQAFQEVSVSKKKSSVFNNSVLSAGKWYKIAVPETGIYKITYDELRSMGFEDPSKLRIFGNGGKMLPEDYRKGNKDELLPTQVHFVKGADNIFNQGDHVLFYGVGPVSWKYDETWGVFRQKKNYYSDLGYYFVTSMSGGPDIPLSGDPAGPITPGYYSSEYDSYTFHETEEKSFKENISGMRTGKEWFGENFTNIVQQGFTFLIPNLVLSEPVKVLTEVLARSRDSSSFYLAYNNQNIDTLKIRNTDITDYTATAAYSSAGISNVRVSENPFDLKLSFNKREGNAMGWLDYITINGRSELRLGDAFLLFRDRLSVAAGMFSSFRISSADNKVIVWDVSDPNNILSFSVNLDGSALSFVAATDSLREFVAFRENGNFETPIINGMGLGMIENQDLHGLNNPDLIILSHKDFLSPANLLADHRRTVNKLDVAVVTSEQVYNEFSSGTPDVTAIRNFMKYLFDKASGDPEKIPRYLLLFGDGSYDNKGIDPNATNLVLTYQSDNSTSPVSSYVSDDYFALLDPGESMNDGLLDVGVGRLPVKNLKEAEAMVTKILDYEKPDRMGDWRNRICFIGDDEDGNIHMAQADQLADYVRYNYPDVNVNKIYLDAYQQVSGPSGQKYPGVNKAINDQMNRGALIINYTGHGGTKGLAHEQVLTMSEILNWKNKMHLPLFMTATCEFSRFDEHEIVSAGEEVLLNEEGGGIALFSTTRLVYSGPNHSLNEKFYQVVFAMDAGEHYRLGDIMKYSKNNTGSGINKRNFSLLGDPSLMLVYPSGRVVIDSLNGFDISIPADTLNALSKVRVSGRVTQLDGSLMESFNGFVFPSVYDKVITQYTLGNDGGSVKSYGIQNNILYKGKASVSSGKFDFSFYVPKDINYAYGRGKFNFYAAGESTDASGSNQDIVIGGSAPDPYPDNQGPVVEVFMNDTFFRSGGITDDHPFLFIKVFDEVGINTSGNGIGHDIVAYLDGGIEKTQNLNDYYQADLDSYQSGEIIYPLSGLEKGWHTVLVKVWDNNNNSGEGYTEFIVLKEENLILDGLINFPNPFSDETWFSFEHNRAGDPLDITIEIFSPDGGLIRTLYARDEGSGFRTQPIYWDGKASAGGIPRQGLYIYRIIIKSPDGQKSEKSGKMIILK